MATSVRENFSMKLKMNLLQTDRFFSINVLFINNFQKKDLLCMARDIQQIYIILKLVQIA